MSLSESSHASYLSGLLQQISDEERASVLKKLQNEWCFGCGRRSDQECFCCSETDVIDTQTGARIEITRSKVYVHVTVYSSIEMSDETSAATGGTAVCMTIDETLRLIEYLEERVDFFLGRVA